jgi:hypothetical protein
MSAVTREEINAWTLAELQSAFDQVSAERHRLYWLFSRSRSASVKPVPATITRRFYALSAELMKRRQAPVVVA